MNAPLHRNFGLVARQTSPAPSARTIVLGLLQVVVFAAGCAIFAGSCFIVIDTASSLIQQEQAD